MRTYDISISPGWAYDGCYKGTVRLPNSVCGFSWRDHAVPRSGPVVGRNSIIRVNLLTARLREQIRRSELPHPCEGIFVHHRDWVHLKIRIAQSYQMPIIAVRRREQLRMPVEGETYSHQTVNCNSMSLVTAIRTHA